MVAFWTWNYFLFYLYLHVVNASCESTETIKRILPTQCGIRLLAASTERAPLTVFGNVMWINWKLSYFILFISENFLLDFCGINFLKNNIYLWMHKWKKQWLIKQSRNFSQEELQRKNFSKTRKGTVLPMFPQIQCPLSDLLLMQWSTEQTMHPQLQVFPYQKQSTTYLGPVGIRW